jgi:hypothetical protein
MSNETSIFDHAADETVKLGNRLAEADPDADLWDIADGLLAGAIHFWLYSRQPCGRLDCKDCAPIATADLRLEELRRMCEEFVRESDYFHAPTDRNVGHA